MSSSRLVTITLRERGDKPDFHLQVDPSSITVSAFKNILETQHGIPASRLRLIHAGVILNDELTLDSYNVREGSVIHVIRNAPDNSLPNEPADSAAAEATTSPLGFTNQNSDSQLMRALSSNPTMRRLAENPELMRAMLLSNPQVRDVVEKNPEYGHMLSDPNFFRQGFEMARNPDKMREVLRNNDRAISNLEMLPGGFNHLKKIYQSLQEPMESAQRGQDSSSDVANRQFAEMYGVQMTEDNLVNNQPLPNPWSPPPQQQRLSRTRGSASAWTPNSDVLSQSRLTSFNDLQNYLDRQKTRSGNSSTTSNGKTSQPLMTSNVQDLQERLRRMDFSGPSAAAQHHAAALEPSPELLSAYATQIERLNEMGFDNLSDNIRALQASGGDVDDAVEWLLQLKG